MWVTLDYFIRMMLLPVVHQVSHLRKEKALQGRELLVTGPIASFDGIILLN
jgi:hypothetical protein